MRDAGIRAVFRIYILSPLMVAGLVLTTVLSPCSLRAETYVIGEVSGHWYSYQSPFIVEGDIWIPVGETLSIHDEVEVLFLGEDSLIVYGTLITDYPTKNRVRFAQVEGTTKRWRGITFKYPTSSESILRHSIVEDAYNSVTCLASNPRIEYNYLEPINYGIKTYDSCPLIIGDTIRVDSSNSLPEIAFGISLDSSPSRVEIEGCVIDIFVSNSLNEISAIGIYGINSTLTLRCNRIHVGAERKSIGIYLQGSGKDSILFNEVLTYSKSSYARAALMQYSCVGDEIINNTFEVNSSHKDNAIFFENCQSMKVMNNIVVGDSMSTGITGILTSVVITYNDFYAHSIISLGCIVDPLTNIFSDPEFVNVPPDCLYYLTARSPCIDMGNPDPMYNDPDGTRSDMGAYYYHHNVEVYPEPVTPTGWEIFSCCPNPTNSSALISFSTKRGGTVNINVYNNLGRLVGQIVDGYFASGVHTLDYDLSPQSSGVYHIMLSTPDGIRFRKLILMK